MTETIENWLRKKMAVHAVSCWVGSVLALLAGILVLFLTFWFTYAVLYVGEWGVSALSELCLGRKVHLSHNWRLVVCGFFVAALFLEWIRRRHAELGNYGEIKSAPGAGAFVYYGGALSAFAMLLANPQASATVITEILYVGPRLILGSFSLARGASRSRQFDTNGCAQVLQMLAAKGSAVTWEELNTTRSEFEGTPLQNNLAQISGIVFLEKGLGMNDELRQELAQLLL